MGAGSGVELFAVDEEWDDMQGVNKDQLLINGGTYASLSSNRAAFDAANVNDPYVYFDHATESNRSKSQYDKYEFQLFTHPSGETADGM